MIPEKIPSNFLLNSLANLGYDANTLNSIKSIGGGSINEAFRLDTNVGSFFVKRNLTNRYPGMFDAEVSGLHLLSAQHVIRVPEAVGIEQDGDYSYLIMEFIEEGTGTDVTWEAFGEKLAALHRKSSGVFGLEHDNYIGSLTQKNTLCDTWPEFFATQRIEPQLNLAHGYFSPAENRKFERLLSMLDSLVPAEPPALVHGDLWSGNYLVDEDSRPVLIDPAVYYGHREADLAMMHLFGGFSNRIFENYHQHYPLEPGWKERIDIHNLYPLLVHVNLFGTGYAGQVRQILQRFT